MSSNNIKKQWQRGFTLAEVLVTLGIIGVVAAMTMPTLITKYKEKTTVTKLKKSYSILNQAYLRAVNEHGNIEDWGFPADSSSVKDPETGESSYTTESTINSKLFFDILTENMPITKKCYPDACDNSYYNMKTIHGTKANTGSFFSIVDLADGSSLVGGWIVLSLCKTSLCGNFGVDINGSKTPPNVIGEDVFFFKISTRGIEAYGSSSESTYAKFPSYCNKFVTPTIASNNGFACTDWVIHNENLDYLHCDDLSWTGKHKCSD